MWWMGLSLLQPLQSRKNQSQLQIQKGKQRYEEEERGYLPAWRAQQHLLSLLPLPPVGL